jgi:hypothetical protein
MKNRIQIYREKTFLVFIELLILLFLLVSTNSSAEILTIEEGDTLYLIDLIESGEYRKYMGEIDFEGCNIEGDTLFIGEERGDYGFSIGSLSVGLNDDRLISYEISG